MPATLAKAPRKFSVLVQDGTAIEAVLTPDATTVGPLELHAFVHCLEIHETEATDRYAALTAVQADITREAAITRDAERSGYSIETARTIYDDCLFYARCLSPAVRQSELDVARYCGMDLKADAIREVMREHGEL